MTGQNAKGVCLKVADTAGSNAPITFGEENNVAHGKVQAHAVALQLGVQPFFLYSKNIACVKEHSIHSKTSQSPKALPNPSPKNLSNDAQNGNWHYH